MGESVWTWSKTAASNATADSSINFAEGQTPGSLNNSTRSMMAAEAKLRDDQGGALTLAGGTTAYTLTTNQVLATLADGVRIHAVVNATNTGASTLAVDGLTAKAIRKNDDRALVAGDMLANAHMVFQYDASANGAAGAWLIVGYVPRVVVQTFTGNGTYTPTPGMRYAIIECVGGGAGGGGTANSGAGTIGGGGGGGGGSYARKLATAADVGASQTVTVGASAAGGTAGTNNGTAGNDTSVGTLCVGKGGSAGQGSASGARGVPGAGGVAGTGDFSLPGQAGAQGAIATIITVGATAGAGGNAGGGWGQGGPPLNNQGTGSAGSNYGGGGGGGYSVAAGGAAAGGAGAQGIVVITEFI